MNRIVSVLATIVVPIALGLGACLTDPSDETASAVLALEDGAGCTHPVLAEESASMEVAWALAKQIDRANGRQELLGEIDNQVNCGRSGCHGNTNRSGGAIRLTGTIAPSNQTCAGGACHDVGGGQLPTNGSNFPLRK